MPTGQQNAPAQLAEELQKLQDSTAHPQAVPAQAVQSTLLTALTNGRPRMSRPVVLPVVDRGRFIPCPPGIVVEDLELCSEPEHPHGQGWVPLRLMWKQPASTGASHSSTSTTQQLPSAASTSAASLVATSSTELQAPLVAAPAVVSAIRSAMSTTHTSLEAARKLTRASRAPDDPASPAAQPAAPAAASQPAVSDSLLTQAQLQSLAVKTQSRAQLHAEERLARQLHDVLNAGTARLRSTAGQAAWQAPGCAPVEAVEQSEEWTEDEHVDAGQSSGAGQAEQQQQGWSGVGMKRPVVILLHATGADMNRLRSEQEACAIAGYLAVTIDCRYHGARCVPQEGQTKRDVYQAALARAWRDAHTQSREGSEGSGPRPERPFLLDTLWDLIHVLDYLETRSDVDIQRVGITGVSLGGMHSLLLAAVEPRIAVAAPMIGVQDFGWAIKNNQWQGRVDSVPHLFEVAAQELGAAGVNTEVVQAVWQLLLPGMLESYDAPMVLNAISPKPLCIVNGELDPRCPMPGVIGAFEKAQQTYLTHYLKTYQPDLLQLSVVPDEAMHLPTPQPSIEPTPEPSPEPSQETLDAPGPDLDASGAGDGEGGGDGEAGGEVVLQASDGGGSGVEPESKVHDTDDGVVGGGEVGSTGALQGGEVVSGMEGQAEDEQAAAPVGDEASSGQDAVGGETNGQVEDTAGAGDVEGGGEGEAQGGGRRGEQGVGMFLTAAGEGEVVGVAAHEVDATLPRQQTVDIEVGADERTREEVGSFEEQAIGLMSVEHSGASAEGAGVPDMSVTQSRQAREGVRSVQGDGVLTEVVSGEVQGSDGDDQGGVFQVPVNTVVDPASEVLAASRVVDHQVLVGKLGKEAGKRAAAAAWVNERLVLYVEPGAGHEEKPGMWSAVRSFLDLHLRGVRRGPAFINRITSHCHKGVDV